MTDGGEGASGRVVASATRLILSEKTRENKSFQVLLRDDVKERRTIAIRDPKIRKKIGDAQRGRTQSEETRKKRSNALLVAYRNVELRKKLSDSQRIRNSDPNERARQSERMKEKWQDVDFRERMEAILQAVQADPEMQKRRLDSVRRANQSPLRAERIKNSVNELWRTEAHRESVLSAARMLGPRASGTSGFKGVSFCKQTSKWVAAIQDNKQRKFIGRFDTSVDAAKAYDDTAASLWGRGNCYLNFPVGGTVRCEGLI